MATMASKDSENELISSECKWVQDRKSKIQKDWIYFSSAPISSIRNIIPPGREEEIKEGREIGGVLQHFSGVKQELPISICFFARKVG